MYLFDGMLLDHHCSALSWELRIELCTNLLLDVPQQLLGSRGLPSRSPSSRVQRQTLHLQSQLLQSLNVLGCPKIIDEGEGKELLRQFSIFSTFAIIFLRHMISLEFSESTCIYKFMTIRQTIRISIFISHNENVCIHVLGVRVFQNTLKNLKIYFLIFKKDFLIYLFRERKGFIVKLQLNT